MSSFSNLAIINSVGNRFSCFYCDFYLILISIVIQLIILKFYLFASPCFCWCTATLLCSTLKAEGSHVLTFFILFYLLLT